MSKDIQPVLPGGLRQTFSMQAAVAGVLSALVGFGSSFAIIIQGLTAVGADPQQAASGLMVLSVSMGGCAIYLSLKSRLPISIAWSTPGAALLATVGTVDGGFNVAVGAFMSTAALIIVAGLWKPLGRSVAAIPPALANAMLAGVLLGLCIAPVRAVAEFPLMALSIIVTWAVVGRINRLYAVPAAVLVTIAIVAATSTATLTGGNGFAVSLWPQAVPVVPAISVPGLIGITLPLFIVTMASQNIPGIAVLKANGYHPEAGPLFTKTGLFSLVATPFGGHAVNLAAITAAMCAGEDAHQDRDRRFWAAVVAGAVYILFGLGAGLATAFISASPPVLIEAVAGLALLGAFSASLLAALSDPKDREAAAVTFLVTASGLTFAGISGAFWGLVAGGCVYGLARLRRS